MTLTSQIEVNVIICNGNESLNDSDILFPNEQVQMLPSNTTFADILAKNDIFKSKGEAKRNGWDKPIPFGFNELFIGKLQHWVCIFNPIPFVDKDENE